MIGKEGSFLSASTAALIALAISKVEALARSRMVLVNDERSSGICLYVILSGLSIEIIHRLTRGATADVKRWTKSLLPCSSFVVLA